MKYYAQGNQWQGEHAQPIAAEVEASGPAAAAAQFSAQHPDLWYITVWADLYAAHAGRSAKPPTTSLVTLVQSLLNVEPRTEFYVEGRARKPGSGRRQDAVATEITAESPAAAAAAFAARYPDMTDITVWADSKAAHQSQDGMSQGRPFAMLMT